MKKYKREMHIFMDLRTKHSVNWKMRLAKVKREKRTNTNKNNSNVWNFSNYYFCMHANDWKVLCRIIINLIKDTNGGGPMRKLTDTVWNGWILLHHTKTISFFPWQSINDKSAFYFSNPMLMRCCWHFCEMWNQSVA